MPHVLNKHKRVLRIFQHIHRIYIRRLEFTLLYWTFVTSTKVCGRFGNLILRSCISASALSIQILSFSASDVVSLIKYQGYRMGDLLLDSSETECFQANIAPSNLFTVSSTEGVFFKLRECSVSWTELDPAVIAWYISLPKLTFADCK